MKIRPSLNSYAVIFLYAYFFTVFGALETDWSIFLALSFID